MSVDLSRVGTGDWIVVGLGLLLLIFSFFGWVSSSYASASYSVGGWHNWWWLAPLLVVAVTVVYALQLTMGLLKKEVRPLYLVFAAAGAVLLYIIALIQIFASYSYSASSAAQDALDSVCSGMSGTDLATCKITYGSMLDMGSNSSSGPGFGIWASIVLSIAFLYFVALNAQKAGEKLPFAIPGPKL
ncbi:hypothetical protein EH165_02855 [Nakamurella antarctica]|uniref:Uncharacterized protein n=1 Tax=Nakamurella antarctica TaxID=1902245 RepID=A0A3G8ZT77_9ACTN|nr:hypothetical protein [Nakamurella antarctica]AZI57256.1 hypothetical protein EH165_02855 [Nakamurella antarctica]